MERSPNSDEFDLPNRSLRGRIAGIIEQACKIGARFSVPIFVPIIGLLVAYIVGGYVFIMLGMWSPSYEFLSLTEDVFFAWLAFLAGGFICIGTGSLIGLAFLTEGEGQFHNEISILFSFIGFGFGAAAMRMTHATVIASILG